MLCAHLKCYLEARLQQDCRKLWVNFCRHPQTEVFVWIQTLDQLQHTTVHQYHFSWYKPSRIQSHDG